MGREGEPIKNFLSRRQVQELEKIGKVVDRWRKLVEEAGGDEEIAQQLAELRGIPHFGGIPWKEKPKLEGRSIRVAVQKWVSRRQ